ncbi:hypothetical protein KGA66_03550 [Actinocrinis puniceicyclus]|uniref:Uncharacterized protein n=1 Tax=Actinocrinis puniceicyclus TaxID=977794 RepID=A0A8J8BAJ1_9ACTN|nr:hypothetical protein [Actinocrinis puniceicyclus]MBS2962108.1 hypothetical protein [Actinocrinis puniceicyclus]
MAKYVINKGYSTSEVRERDVVAHSFKTVGDFVDFVDTTGEIILRVKASHVVTIERVIE